MYPTPVVSSAAESALMDTAVTAPPDTFTTPIAPDPLPVIVWRLTSWEFPFSYPLPALVMVTDPPASEIAESFSATTPLAVVFPDCDNTVPSLMCGVSVADPSPIYTRFENVSMGFCVSLFLSLYFVNCGL